MRQSELFTKTRREAPKDETAKNAQLLIRAGYINKRMAGAYEYLPLGLRTFKKIEHIVRTEMNRIGGQELMLTTLQDPEVWKASGRWSDEEVDVWFKTELAGSSEVGLANTHEEPLTELLKNHISSYKDLPLYAYQFQTKFRNELRSKSGILRTREFVMKDLYSFSKTQEEHDIFYERCASAYHSIFELVGLGDVTFRTFASGGSFSKYSDEFQTLSGAGEDTIYLERAQGVAVNKEVYTDDVLSDLGLQKEELEEHKAIEVGNIFSLGTRFSEALGLNFRDQSGNEQPVIMGCYGIGPGRLMGTVVEVFSDEKGIVWPATIAPFELHLIELSGGDAKIKQRADALYERLSQTGVDILYDDRDLRAGEKFADSDLLGIPQRVIVGTQSVEKGMVELVDRTSGESTVVTEEELLQLS